MTYCIALKTPQGILVAGDSALSSKSSHAFQFPNRKRTSFGERQGQMESGQWPYVFEEGQKVLIGAAFVAAIAGDVATADNILQIFQEAYVGSVGSRDAAEVAVRSAGPFSSDATVLIGSYVDGEPVLLRIDTERESVDEIEGLVQIGSDLPRQHEWTDRVVGGLCSFAESLGSGPRHTERLFSQVICLLQSYVTHDYLLERGVGGAFVGGWITQAGTRWQGDHLYVVHSDVPLAESIDMCGTFIRDSSICLISNQNEVVQISRESHAKRDRGSTATSLDVAIRDFDHGLFDYFVSLNTQKHIVTVIEMNRSHHHRLVSICPQSSRAQLGIIWTEDLVGMARTFAGVEEPDGHELTLRFIPYIAITEYEASTRDEFASETGQK